MERYKVISPDFYSNCLIEALKAKFNDPNVEITVCMPWENECFCPHFLWSDGYHDYDFGFEDYIPLVAAWTIHRGHIRSRKLGFNKRYKKVCKDWSKRHGILSVFNRFKC